MFDIAAELAKLHALNGSAYSKQVERIARKGRFFPVEGEPNVYAAIGEGGEDYDRLLRVSRHYLPSVGEPSGCRVAPHSSAPRDDENFSRAPCGERKFVVILQHENADRLLQGLTAIFILKNV